MLIFILMNIIVIIFIYLRYYNFPKEVYLKQEKINDLDSISMGYINDLSIGNNTDLIIAEIIDLNIKGYITIKYSKENLNKTNYIIKQNVDEKSPEINEIDMLVMSFLFKEKTEITKEELEEKLSNSFELYNIQYNEIKKILEKKMIEKNIVDVSKQKELKKNKKIYKRASLILIILSTILMIAKVIDFSIIYIIMYLIEYIIIIVMLSKASIYTNEGQIIKYNIDRRLLELKNRTFLTDKNTMEKIVKDKDFSNSLALHIKTDAKSIFVDDIITKNALDKSKKVAQGALILSIIITILIIVLGYLVSKMSKDAIKWLFILYVIIIACITDSIFAKGYKRK